jgi:hypothetical protein
MWGYMLNGPGMTNSAFLEGYRIDDHVHYPAYRSAARTSHAHGWSAGPTTVLMQGVLGIKLVSPLGKMWEIEPHLTKWLSYACGGFATKLGKFEVSITLIRSQKTGRKIECLKIAIPKSSTGWVKWGGKAVLWSGDWGKRAAWYRYLEPWSLEEEWQDWSAESNEDYVRDETWVKPEVEERPEGVVDWEALEKDYGFARQRYGDGLYWTDDKEPEVEPGSTGPDTYQVLLKSFEVGNKARMWMERETRWSLFEAFI